MEIPASGDNKTDLSGEDGSDSVPVLIPAASWGSLGDQAAVQGMIALLGICDIARRSIHDQWLGYTLLSEYENPHDPVYCIGADVLDGAYGIENVLTMLDYCGKAADDGNPVSICGYSFSAKPRPEILQKLRELPPSIRFVARDLASSLRFQSFTGRRCILGADPAFLLPHDPNLPGELTDWLHRPGPKLAFNVSSLLGAPPCLLRDLLDAGNWNVILIPHDVRRKNDDRLAIELQIENLRPSHKGRWIRSWTKETFLSPAQAKFLTTLVDVVFTQRMHLAIAALGNGTPCIARDYNLKVTGCFKHFEAEDLVYLTSGYTKLSEDLYSAVSRKDQIRSHLGKVQAMARLNKISFTRASTSSSTCPE